MVLATLGYRLCGYGWLDAVWMVVITISTVGYGESSTTTPAVQALSVVVILVGISAASVTFSGVLQVMVEGEIQKVLGRRRMTREIEQLRNHVIICGYGLIVLYSAVDQHTGPVIAQVIRGVSNRVPARRWRRRLEIMKAVPE